MPCWDDVGEELILATVTEDMLADPSQPLFYAEPLLQIRNAFLSGRDPYDDLCSRCAVRGHDLVTSRRPEIISRYPTMAPHAPDRQRVEQVLAELDPERRLRRGTEAARWRKVTVRPSRRTQTAAPR
jgi:hypothetical protein